MQKLTGTGQKLRCAKLFGIRIVKYLTWNLHSNYIISKLNCRISLLEKWNLDCGKLLYNSLSIIEYYCTVWGNCSKEQLDIFLRLQERCARMILDANFQDNSGMLFTKLDWLLIDDIIRTRKLSLLHKICNGCGPEYLSSYVNYVKSSHDYNTRTSRRNYLITPKCKKNSGLRTFHSSATRLWNKTEPSLRDTLSQKRFLRDLQRK